MQIKKFLVFALLLVAISDATTLGAEDSKQLDQSINLESDQLDSEAIKRSSICNTPADGEKKSCISGVEQTGSTTPLYPIASTAASQRTDSKPLISLE